MITWFETFKVNLVTLACASAVFFILPGCGDTTRESGVSGASKAISEKAAGFQPELVPTVYRFAKISTGAYFYTGSEVEVGNIFANYPDFRYEGPAFEQDTSGNGTPVYRFANTANGGYFYTGSEAEKNQVIASYPNMRFEGSTFAVAPAAQADAKDIYRLANLNNGAYLYTLSAVERDYAVSLGNWRFEGSTFKAPKGSPLLDKTWLAGKLLETSATTNFFDGSVGIDDVGNATVMYSQAVALGGESRMYAVHGKPNSTGAVAWSTPVVINSFSPQPTPENNFYDGQSLFVLPNGNAIAVWRQQGRCNATAYCTDTSGYAAYLTFATYSAATQQWSTAQSITSAPPANMPLIGRMNAAGDIAIFYGGWVRVPGSASPDFFSIVPAVVSRKAGQSFVTRIFEDTNVGADKFTNVKFTLDNNGGMVLAGNADNNPPNNVLPNGPAAYRGAVGSGFGAQLTFPSRPSNIVDLATSLAGRSVIVYEGVNSQNRAAMYAASSFSNTAFTVEELTTNYGVDWTASVADDNTIRLNFFSGCQQWVNKVGGTWTLLARPTVGQYNECLPFNGTPIRKVQPSVNRNGDFVVLEAFSGERRWVSYDARRNRIIQQKIDLGTAAPNKGYLLGFDATTANLSNGGSWATSISGQTIFVNDNQFEVLPTLNSPSGVQVPSGSIYRNLWGFYLN
jgi:hypothetical protein